MPLESATYIDQLDASWPLNGDFVNEGDDHLRLIKSTLQNSFINATYPLDLSKVGSLVGSIMLYGSATPPEGWFACNGTALSRTTYAELYTVIGVNFGAGDGSTTFNLPDLRDMVPGGLSSTNAIGTTAGKDVWDSGDLPAHNHTMVSDGAHTHPVPNELKGVYDATGNNTAVQGDNNPNDNFTATSAGAHTHTINSTGTGGDNRQQTTYVNYIIKT